MHNDFIYGTADVPFDDEPLLPTANVDDGKGSCNQPALSWPDACAEVARAFIAASRGGPPVLMPVDDGPDTEPLPLTQE